MNTIKMDSNIIKKYLKFNSKNLKLDNLNILLCNYEFDFYQKEVNSNEIESPVLMKFIRENKDNFENKNIEAI